jgi:hypothetical protein
MSELISNEKLAEIIESEGLGYTFTDYLDPMDIADVTIRDLARIATDALKEIEARLEQ